MAYLVISYPELSWSDYNWIQRFRRENDPLYYSVVEPHFTLVFPVFDIEETAFVQEATKLLAGVNKIDFTLRCATINKDAFSDYYHILLVPDEGFSKIVKLHDRLYSGLFKSNLRLDIDFIPHIGIGNSLDKTVCKQWVDDWNSQDFEINGSINQIDIIEYDNNKVSTVEIIKLK